MRNRLQAKDENISLSRLVASFVASGFVLAASAAAQSEVSVATYHNDPQRTGWNATERILTPSNVRRQSFGLIFSVALDDLVNAQPLVVANQQIAGQGFHDVVFVATEGNTVYAIDAASGAVRLKTNLGKPVPRPQPPCGGSGVHYGVDGTPTIDVVSKTMYVMVYTLKPGVVVKDLGARGAGGTIEVQPPLVPTYELHALDLSTLKDRAGSPVTVAALHTLADGSQVGFNGAVQRQRPGLLLSGGNIYAAFGSFCDLNADQSRGWLLGWKADTLTPLGANELTNTRRDPSLGTCATGVFRGQVCAVGSSGANCPNPGKSGSCRYSAAERRFTCSGGLLPGAFCNPGLHGADCLEPGTAAACKLLPEFYLSSIWMSGYGAAADDSGNVFFVTGNSQGAVNTYSKRNLSESVVKMLPDLSEVTDFFTPQNVANLDATDGDLGAGGVMVVPDQSGSVPRLAVAAGKDCRLFILNRDNLSGFDAANAANYVDIGGSQFLNQSIGCWTGPSYYRGSDQVARVVSSGTIKVETWRINTGARSSPLQLEASAQLPFSVQDGGFFTSVSSNGTYPNTAIIWAIGRPFANGLIQLYAFNGTPSGGTLPLLWSCPAGVWNGGNANLVPTIANGRVYVASYGQLQIFGLTSNPRNCEGLVNELTRVLPTPQLRISGALYWGTIRSVEGSRITVVLRTGKVLRVDVSEAVKNGDVPPIAGRHIAVNGAVRSDGVLQARAIWRAKAPGSWGPDSP